MNQKRKIVVRVNPVNSVIQREGLKFNEFLEIVREVDDLLKVRDTGYVFTQAFKSGRWDGYTRFITAYGLFLTGLLPLVGKIFDIDELYPVTMKVFKGDINYNLKGISLRDYQKEAVATALKSGRGILKMPAGAGKTEAGCCIAQNLVKYGKVLWVTHTLDLLEQSRERFMNRTGLSVSATTKGFVDTSGDVVVSTVQTLHSKAEEVQKFLNNEVATVIFDECHLGSASIWESVLRSCKSAWFRYGLSATPETDSDVRNRKLIGLLGRVIYTADSELLKSSGYIVNTTVYGIKYPHKNYMSYQDSIAYGVIDNNGRNSLIVDICGKEKGGLVLVNFIRHGKILEQIAKERGFNTVFLYGEVSSDVRLETVKKIRNGEYDFVIASTIFDFGVDIPELRWIFLASPTKSSVRIIQRIGRGARKSKGKDVAKVYVILDTGDRFLSSASSKLLKVVSKEGLDVSIQTRDSGLVCFME